jgi:hypothetical protein
VGGVIRNSRGENSSTGTINLAALQHLKILNQTSLLLLQSGIGAPGSKLNEELVSSRNRHMVGGARQGETQIACVFESREIDINIPPCKKRIRTRPVYRHSPPSGSLLRPIRRSLHPNNKASGSRRLSDKNNMCGMHRQSVEIGNQSHGHPPCLFLGQRTAQDVTPCIYSYFLRQLVSIETRLA